jgi:hypothetical protein
LFHDPAVYLAVCLCQSRITRKVPSIGLGFGR